MNKTAFIDRVKALFEQHEEFLKQPNPPQEEHNGQYQKYQNPVLTWKHSPIFWRYDLHPDRNPHLMERLGINTTFNAGAIEWNGKIVLVPRVEGVDVKSFFALAESDNGVDNFKFRDHPIVMPETDDPDMNVYDIRLTAHEDGWVYGLFCTERKDKSKPYDSSAAIAQNGIARTKDLQHWERLPDLKTSSTQQRNCVLHPEFVNGQYAFYTRPMDGFIETGGGSGIGWGTCPDITKAEIKEEIIMDPKQYHTVKEVKNGAGPAPIKTPHGWIHLAHGVRRTAAGLRYVLYCFLCDLNEPWKVLRRPAGHYIAPHGAERVGDVSNVVFSNGWVLRDNGEVFIYYASSDTRMHVATTSLDQLIDYVLHTPEDPGRTYACVQQRTELINDNLEWMTQNGLRP